MTAAIVPLKRGRGGSKGKGESERKKAIYRVLRKGGSRTAAAAAARMSVSALDDWIRNDDAVGRLVAAAESLCQQDRLEFVLKAASTRWEAAAWLLERRFPETYARRYEPTQIEKSRMAAKVGQELAKTLIEGLNQSNLPAGEREALRKRLAETIERVAASA